MTEFITSEFLQVLIPVLIAGAGILYGWLKNQTLKQVVSLSQTFARQGACYLRIKSDGTITVEEKAEMGELAIDFFEGIEQITGFPVFNDKAVPWIKPEEPQIISSENLATLKEVKTA